MKMPTVGMGRGQMGRETTYNMAGKVSNAQRAKGMGKEEKENEDQTSPCQTRPVHSRSGQSQSY